MADYVNKVKMGYGFLTNYLRGRGLAVLPQATGGVTNDELRIYSSATLAFLLLSDPGAAPGALVSDAHIDDFCRRARVQTANHGMQIINPVVERWDDSNVITPAFAVANFGGLAGDFAPYNGDHLLVAYMGGAATQDFLAHDIDPSNRIELVWQGAVWELRVSFVGVGLICLKTWELASTASDPVGAYTEAACDVSDCVDGDSCTDSAGATAKVKYAGTDW